MEDKASGLQRSFPDIDPLEAQERAMTAMGDPEEVRAALAKVHKPVILRAIQIGGPGNLYGVLAQLGPLPVLDAVIDRGASAGGAGRRLQGPLRRRSQRGVALYG